MDAAGRGPQRPRSSTTDLLHVAVERQGEHARVAASGKIDRATSPRLATALEELSGDQGVRRVTVDLGGVTFLDSSGLHLLCSTASEADHDGLDFAVTRPNPHIRRLLVLPGLDQLVLMVER